jgi:hypothetical protein
MPSVPPAAIAPVASASEYPADRISRSAIGVIVAAVATEDPQTAPKQAEAPMVATASPPLTPDVTTRAALNKSADRPEAEATPPVRINSGTTDKV